MEKSGFDLYITEHAECPFVKGHLPFTYLESLNVFIGENKKHSPPIVQDQINMKHASKGIQRVQSKLIRNVVITGIVTQLNDDAIMMMSNIGAVPAEICTPTV